MRTIAITLLVVAILLSFTACDDAGTTTPPLGNTPAQVLEALERAFQERDAELLDGLIDTEFTFHFDPKDVGKQVGDYTIPAMWGREETLAACGNMFTEAYSIDFLVVTKNTGEPDDGATEFTARNIQVTLLVMVDSMNGAQADGFCDFGFVNDDSAGYDDWTIIDWWDRTSEGLWSLGLILVQYYE
jgi:hypothetical protein